MIADHIAKQSPVFAGEIEVDERYFGGVRKGKRGRGASGKVPVFGLLKRDGMVHAAMIPDAKSLTLIGIIRKKVKPDSIFLLIASPLMTRPMSRNSIMCASTTQKNSQKTTIISLQSLEVSLPMG